MPIFTSGGNKDTVTDPEELDDEEMLKRAIAMSLQEEEEKLFSMKGELLKRTTNLHRYCKRVSILQMTRKWIPAYHLQEMMRMRF